MLTSDDMIRKFLLMWLMEFGGGPISGDVWQRNRNWVDVTDEIGIRADVSLLVDRINTYVPMKKDRTAQITQEGLDFLTNDRST
jgi:hypothetical protein